MTLIMGLMAQIMDAPVTILTYVIAWVVSQLVCMIVEAVWNTHVGRVDRYRDLKKEMKEIKQLMRKRAGRDMSNEIFSYFRQCYQCGTPICLCPLGTPYITNYVFNHIPWTNTCNCGVESNVSLVGDGYCMICSFDN